MAETNTTLSPRIKKLQEFKLASPVLTLDVTADGSIVYAGCQDGGVFSVRLDSGQITKVCQHSSYASSVVLMAGGTVLVSGGYDGILLWNDLSHNRLLREVRAHEFWSWDLAASPDGRWLGSVTGRYQVGGYKYEPAPEREPSVKVYDAKNGELRWQFPHVPPTQAVAFSPDGQHIAAGNLMGEVRVWNLEDGKQVSAWRDDGLTSWGVIKSHHFLGGIFALKFSPDGREIYVCGMGPMVDPMAGNGVQRWQRFDWKAGNRLDQTHEGESGQGLMETLAFHPSGKVFVMAGRLFQGTWNLALFDRTSGKNVFSTDAKHRITGARFTQDGSRLLLSKAKGQNKPSDGKWTDAGLIEVHEVFL